MSDAEDRLTGQLMHLPTIIGNLGLNIAAAQARLDDNYLRGVERLMRAVKSTVGSDQLNADAYKALLAAEKAFDEAKVTLTDKEAELQAAGGNDEAKKTARDEALKGLEDAETKLGDAQARAGLASAMMTLITALAPSRYQFTQTTLDFSADLAETRDQAFQVGGSVGLQAITVNAAYSSSFGYDYRAAARITTVMNAITADPVLTRTLMSNATAIQSEKLPPPERATVEDKVWDRATEIYKALGSEPAKIEDGGT